jgi:hypothetical protein
MKLVITKRMELHSFNKKIYATGLLKKFGLSELIFPQTLTNKIILYRRR